MKKWFLLLLAVQLSIIQSVSAHGGEGKEGLTKSSDNADFPICASFFMLSGIRFPIKIQSQINRFFSP